MPRRWYQTVYTDDPDVVFEDENRKDSKFWNEGKWRNFIVPLLPDEWRTFIELGCNAGLYLKMAADAGFTEVIGVEGNKRIMQQAVAYRTYNKGTYKLIDQNIGVDFDLLDLPVADVILIANTHYYLSVDTFSKLIDALKSRCAYCIIVSAKAKRRRGNALYDLSSVFGYFRDWERVGFIADVDTANDPCPREDMYSVCFKGSLTPINVSEYWGEWREASKTLGHRSHGLPPALQQFFGNILTDYEFVYEDSFLYEWWRRREPNRSDKWIQDLLDYKASLVKDIQINGFKDPIYINWDNKLLDGLHRLAIAERLGHEHILARIL